MSLNITVFSYRGHVDFGFMVCPTAVPDPFLIADRVEPALAARMYTRNNLARFAPPASNVVISNVPGPDFPLYIAGGLVEAIYPMGPLLMGMSLNITVFSYRGHVDFGFMACPTAVPDPFLIADRVEPALAALEAAMPATASA